MLYPSSVLALVLATLLCPVWSASLEENVLDETGQHLQLEKIEQLVQRLCIKTVDSIEPDVAEIVNKLLQAKQSLIMSSTQEHQLWNSVRSGRLCGTSSAPPKLIDIYLDILARTGTESAIDVLILAYEMNMLTPTRASYLFSMLSFVNKHPSLSAAEKLITLVEVIDNKISRDHIPRGIILGVSGYLHNFKLASLRPSEISALQRLTSRIANVLLNNLDRNLANILQQSLGDTLAIVDALGNIQLDESHSAIAKRLLRIVQDSFGVARFCTVRIAIVRVLTPALNGAMRAFLLEKMFTNPRESPEMQIQVYQTLILSGTNAQELEKIKAHLEKIEKTSDGLQVTNYIRSHVHNLATSTDSSRRALLPWNATRFEPPSKQMVGVSRNYEFGFAYQPFGMGVRVDVDVLYGNAHTHLLLLPQHFYLNITLTHVSSAQTQLLELRIHQNKIQHILAFKTTEASARISAKELLELLLSFDDADFWNNFPDAQLAIEMAVDGKTIAVFDQTDLAAPGRARSSLFATIAKNLEHQFVLDNAVTLIPFDSEFLYSSPNGMLTSWRLNSTMVLGLKTQLDFDARKLGEARINFVLIPSLSAQFESIFKVYGEQGKLHQASKSVVSMLKLHSAPHIALQLETHQGRRVTFKLNIPRERFTLAQVEFFTGSQDDHERLAHSIRRKDLERLVKHAQHKCAQWPQQVFGLAVCLNSLEDVNVNHTHQITELSIQKTDSNLEALELTSQFPFSIDQIFSTRHSLSYRQIISSSPLRPQIKLAFDTPGSKINRKVVLELDLPWIDARTSELRKQICLRLALPDGRLIQIDADHVSSEKIDVDLVLNGRHKARLEIDNHNSTTSSSQIIEHRPRIMLKLASRFDSIHMRGLVTIKSGGVSESKKSLRIHLEDEQRKHTYLDATLASYDESQAASANIGWDGFGLFVDLQAELGAKQNVAFSLNTRYRTFWMAHNEQLNAALKLQSMDNDGVFIWNNLGQLEASQHPSYNVRYSQSGKLTNQTMEHDLKLGWGKEIHDKIHLAQSSQLVVDRTDDRYELQAMALTVIRPKQIDCKLEGSLTLVGWANATIKQVDAQFHGVDRIEKDNNVRGELHYRSQPVVGNVSLVVKSVKGVEFFYRDAIKQIDQHNYIGRRVWQLSSSTQRYMKHYHVQVVPRSTGKNNQLLARSNIVVQ